MTKLILTDGETYRTRSGSPVRITSISTITPWKFSGSNGEIYRTNGRNGLFGESKLDLVEVSDTKLCTSVAEALDKVLMRMAA